MSGISRCSNIKGPDIGSVFGGAGADISDDFIRKERGSGGNIVEVVVGNIPTVVILLISHIGKSDLLEVVDAGGAFSAFTRA